MVQEVLLASPRGFCAGVEMAIKSLSWLVRLFEPPVYCFHEIVHNQIVVEAFSRAGVIFVDDIGEVPAGSVIMLSAHGSAPEVVAAARNKGSFVVNAVCPLVTKVHHEARVRANKGYQIVYVGHKGHDEAVGTIAVAPDSIHLVESPSDLKELDIHHSPVALLAQTTLAHSEWQEVLVASQQRYNEVWTAGRSDLCFATTNRQAAIKQLAVRADSIVVIGSANSSNTIALTKVATAAGCQRVIRVDSAGELPRDLAGVVGVTAGASAPETLVDEVIKALDPSQGVKVIVATDEEEYFPLPSELRELLTGAQHLVTNLALSQAPSILEADRSTPASTTLELLEEANPS